jgi:exopolysaccharide production protein ExoQ
VNPISLHIASIIGLHLPPTLALLVTIVFVVFLFRRDIRERPNVTGALWLPVVWMLLIGSRSVMGWLNTWGLVTLGSVEEGNPIDALVYFSLIVAGVAVLNQRQVSLSEVLRQNGWLMAFIAYCFIAIVWSDYPFISFKRWIKILGHPIMALIILTEPDPKEALERLMKRSAYILVPFSILLIKYYPEIGRKFDDWTGQPMNNGITTHKNLLGAACLILGFFFFWHLLITWRRPRDTARRKELRLIGALLFMIAWLLWKAHSATSLLSLLIAILVVLALGRRWVNKKAIGAYIVLAVIGLAVAELTFGIFGRIVDLTGHESTIMGRAELWGQLLALRTNPIFGTGFESFWLGDRLVLLSEGRPWQPNEAHNGYLEIYLNLGLIGLLMLIGLFIATFRKIRTELLQNFEWGRFRLAFLVAAVLYNWTEAAFRGLNLVWFAFYIIALDYLNLGYEPVVRSREAVAPEEETELAYYTDSIQNR